jgi:hypothetical protein
VKFAVLSCATWAEQNTTRDEIIAFSSIAEDRAAAGGAL